MKHCIYLLVFACCFACSSSSDPGPKSAEGSWTYTTPDSKVTVTFDLIKSAGGDWSVQNPKTKINGNLYQTVAIFSGLAPPAIGNIRISANDANAVYPYPVIFNNGTVSSDFKKINVPDGSYEYPNGTVNTLTNIVITRP